MNHGGNMKRNATDTITILFKYSTTVILILEFHVIEKNGNLEVFAWVLANVYTVKLCTTDRVNYVT